MNANNNTQGERDIKKRITVEGNAMQLVKNVLQRPELFKFFDNLNRDVIEYVELFGHLGINQEVIWNLYEEWQEI